MVGRELDGDLFPPPPECRRAGDVQFAVRLLNVALPRKTRRRFCRDISFELRGGEVLGFGGGLMGAGRTELLMHLLRRVGSAGERRRRRSRAGARRVRRPRDSIARGLVLVSEDRKRYGLVLEQPIGFNLSLSSLRQFSRGTQLDLPAEQVRNQQLFESLRVKAPDQRARVGGLSGGNQQKIVLGKALMTEPTVVMLDEPTRGIDVGAKLEVYQLVNRLTAEGEAVILVSSELPELMGMSDRVIMLHEGRIGGEFARAPISRRRNSSPWRCGARCAKRGVNGRMFKAQ